jgi:hypothetical protein
MNDVVHLNAGARSRQRLVISDSDRADLLGRLRAALGDGLLAYCLMDTHVHGVVEGREGVASAAAALRAYARSFNRRHGLGGGGGLLRGPVHATPVPDPEELARAIRYVHENPVRTNPPMARRAIDFEWSSARDFAGLSADPAANVSRARALLGPSRAARAVGFVPAIAPLDRSRVPRELPGLLLAAAAQAFRLRPDDLAGGGRGPEVAAARRVYVRLGALESYSHAQLAPFLGRSRTRVTEISAEPVDERHVRIARTLLAEPGLRARLLGSGAGGTDRARTPVGAAFGAEGTVDRPNMSVWAGFGAEGAVDRPIWPV